MTNKDVAEKFLRKEKANTLHLLSTGEKIYSYNTVIAQWYKGDLIGNATKYSVTTSKHMLYIRRYINIHTRDDVPRSTNNLIPYLYN